jgi:hypothetical protein
MFSLKLGEIASPVVKTSDFGGLPCEDLAQLCTDKIIGVADSAPPAIREQAKFFRERVQRTVFEYLKRAQQSERATCIQICLQGGEENAANILRRS